MSDSPERSARPPLDPELLGRFLAGECSDAEAAAVRRVLMAHPDVARALARALSELEGGPERPAAPDSAASWAVLRDRLRAAREAELAGALASAPPRAGAEVPRAAPASRPTPASAPAAPRRGGVARVRAARWRRPGVAAAWAAGVCAVLLGGAVLRGRRAESGLASGPVAADTSARMTGGRQYVTAPGQRTEVLLGDGTRVRLAPASRLRVATDYGAGRRDVYLEGEAFFDVVHDERRPFTVFAANASARDLGTQFSVRSYPDERAVQVVVREGAVALSGVGPLSAGDVGRLTAAGRTSVRRGIDADSALRWLEGRLAFHDAPLAQVLRDIGRWYDVDVSADSALTTLPFTGTIAGGSADEAVELVAATLGLQVQIDGGRRVLRMVPGRTPPAGGALGAPPPAGRVLLPAS